MSLALFQCAAEYFRLTLTACVCLFSNTTVTLDCYWRGRVMVTDTPEIQRRIGLVSVRIDTSPQGSRAWVTADPDEETGMKQTQIAPVR